MLRLLDWFMSDVLFFLNETQTGNVNDVLFVWYMQERRWGPCIRRHHSKHWWINNKYIGLYYYKVFKVCVHHCLMSPHIHFFSIM